MLLLLGPIPYSFDSPYSNKVLRLWGGTFITWQNVIIIAVSTTVLIMFGLVAASTMAQSVRERTNELAVLKTLGFSNGLIVGLVLAESLFMAVLAGALGLGLTYVLVSHGSFNNAFLPVLVLRGRDLVVGAVLCCLLGALAGALPAASAMRLRITDALRRN